MRISQSLERIRKPEVAAFSQRQKLLRWGACVLLGGALGFLSKWVEALPHRGTIEADPAPHPGGSAGGIKERIDELRSMGTQELLKEEFRLFGCEK